MLRLILLLAAIPAAWAASPVQVAVITRYPQAFQDAMRTFEARHGKGLVDLRLLDGELRCDELAGARAVYVHDNTWTPRMRQCAGAAQAMERRGTVFAAAMGSVVTTHWQVKSAASLEAGAEYVSAGGAENLAGFIALLYRAAGGDAALSIAPVRELAETGIYHPRAPGVFASLPDFLAWYRSAGLVPPGSPLVGITFFRANYAYGDVAHIDALTAALERRGIGAVAVFAWPLRNAEPLLFVEGKPAVRLLLCLSLPMGNADDAAFLQQHGLRAINLATTTESFAAWSGSNAGLPSHRLGTQIISPERAGATEPLLIATTETPGGGGAARLVPVPERVEAAAARAARWVALGAKPNHEKRLAVIYYNNPPGKATLGASYLNLIPSLVNMLERLREEGYLVDTRTPDEEQLKSMLMLAGRNVGDYAPGELDALLREGHAALLPLQRYLEWYRELPGEFRALTEKTWGRPEDSRLMTVRAEGQVFFVIPGIRLGNIFLGPQPLRGDPMEEADRQHDPNHPVPHSYIAAYLWRRHHFRADALVHMGRHGTVEWLPGKAVAQAGSDSGEVLIGDLPNLYFYVVDGGGEFLQAKRRSGAVMISHLTPLLVSAGLPPEHRKLHDAIENRARSLDVNETLRMEYEAEIIAEARRLKLDRQLGFSIDEEDAEKVVGRVEAFIHDVASQAIPTGMHTIGAPPDRDVLRQALAKFIESAFAGEEARRAQPWAGRWAAALLEGRTPEGPPGLLDKVRTEAEKWLAAIEESPSRELAGLMRALEGGYVPTGVSGDPLRSPAAVPTGRNLHDLDPRAFPTRAAWEVGRRMAGELLGQWAEKHGEFPEKLSFVLWYGESTRHQGIAEAQALSLLGVEPVWNGRGHVVDVTLVPAAELGRPRVDVVLTMSGLYRDSMQEKVQLLDKAVRLAAAAPDDNPVRRNTQRVEQRLLSRGVDRDTARAAAAARVFGPAPGAFGAGLSGMMESSGDQGDQKAIGEAYLDRMGYAYADGLWGKDVGGNLREQLRGNQAVIHSRSTNLYGVLDNDETYQFAGGLSAATVAAGSAEPGILISNVRQPGQERLEEMKYFLTREMSSRLWNPRWIEGMKQSGYSGAQQMAKEVEHLYGLRATAPSTVDRSVWQQTFDVYIADKHRLGLDKYFSEQSPHAQQMLAARLLEVDRQGIHRFSGADRRLLVRTYVESVNRSGVSCYANACDNRRLLSYVAAQSGEAVSRASAEMWRRRMSEALTSSGAARPARPASPRPALSGRRATGQNEWLSSVRIFEVSEGRILVGDREVGLEWLLAPAAIHLLGTAFAFLLRRRAPAPCLRLLPVSRNTPEGPFVM